MNNQQKALIVTPPRGLDRCHRTEQISRKLKSLGFETISMETLHPNIIGDQSLHRFILSEMGECDLVIRSNGWANDSLCRLIVKTSRDFGIECVPENMFLVMGVDAVLPQNWLDRKIGWFFTNAMKISK